MSQKPPKPDPEAPTGRIAFDDRGNAVWQWRTETGTFKSDIDTREVKALQEQTGAQLGEAPPPAPPPSHNPYSTADSFRPADKKRRTLDDMRKLSEEIKRSRELKKSS
jgi:hypothetical protein